MRSMIMVAVVALLLAGCAADAAPTAADVPAVVEPLPTTTITRETSTTTTTSIVTSTTTTTTRPPTTTTEAPTTTTTTTTQPPPTTTTQAPTTTTTTTTQPPKTTHTVSMGDFFNAPEAITIGAGDTVRWVNDGAEVHDIVSGEDPNWNGAWSSPEVVMGASWSRTFDAPGMYPYFCQIHAGAMPGTVIVES